MEEKPHKVVVWVGKHIDLLDKVFVLLIVGALVLKYLKLWWWTPFFIVTMIAGAVLYYFWAYFDSGEEEMSRLERTMYMVQRTGASLALTGIMFDVMVWKGAIQLLIIGALTTVVTTGFSIYYYVDRPHNRTNNLDSIIKFGFLCVVTTWMILT